MNPYQPPDVDEPGYARDVWGEGAYCGALLLIVATIGITSIGIMIGILIDRLALGIMP